jgi:hypothetical protein
VSRPAYPLNLTRLRAELDGHDGHRCDATGKVAYPDQPTAQAALTRVRATARTKQTPAPKRVRRCGSHWHLTSMTPAVARRYGGRR